MIKLLFKVLAVLCSVTILLIPMDTAAKTPTVPNNEIHQLCRATVAVLPDNGNIRIMTYNILSDGIGFEGSPAATRSHGVLTVINELSPDIICLQEVSRGWMTIIKNLSDYSIIRKTESEIAGLMTILLYNKNTVILNESGNEILSSGGDYRMRRAVWGIFKSRESNVDFAVINTHFNVTKDENYFAYLQALEITTVAARIRKQYNCPVFIAGDFNARQRTTVSYPSSAVYEILSSHFTDTVTLAENIYTFYETPKKNSAVDHIFLVGTADIVRYIILSNQLLLHISDHYPVFIDVTIR